MHCNITSSESKYSFTQSETPLAFIQVIDNDFLRIRNLINASGALWRTLQTSSSDALSVNIGFKNKC